MGQDLSAVQSIAWATVSVPACQLCPVVCRQSQTACRQWVWLYSSVNYLQSRPQAGWPWGCSLSTPGLCHSINETCASRLGCSEDWAGHSIGTSSLAQTLACGRHSAYTCFVECLSWHTSCTMLCGYLFPNWHFRFCSHHSRAPGVALMTPYLTEGLHLMCAFRSKVSVKLVLDAKS